MQSGVNRARMFVGGILRSVLTSERDTLEKLELDINAIARARTTDAYDETCIDPDTLFSQQRANVVTELEVLRNVVEQGAHR